MSPAQDRGYLELVAHYEDCLARHGDNHRGVDWPAGRGCRPALCVMLGLIPLDSPRPVRLLDFGCGAGHLLEYIRRHRVVGTSSTTASICRIDSCRSAGSKFPDVPFTCRRRPR